MVFNQEGLANAKRATAVCVYEDLFLSSQR